MSHNTVTVAPQELEVVVKEVWPESMDQQNLLIIFARNPELGKVKKRLAAKVGELAALAVYQKLLQRTLDVVRSASFNRKILFSEETIPDCPEGFEQGFQRGKDLGERMEKAFKQGFRKGYSRILLIGTDLYELDLQDLDQGFKALEENEYVFGPAVDGGYYLVGMKATANYKIFKNKSWGSTTVLQETLTELKDKKVAMLVARNDVDTVEDLNQVPELVEIVNKIKDL